MSVGSGCSIAFKLSSTLGWREGHLKVLSWGWLYLSSILDDYSLYIISWKLCSNMRAEDVTDTLDLALQASGYDQVAG
jgi:transposase InsO family protein